MDWMDPWDIDSFVSICIPYRDYCHVKRGLVDPDCDRGTYAPGPLAVRLATTRIPDWIKFGTKIRLNALDPPLGHQGNERQVEGRI